MGEIASARTERELADLRASIDVDLQELRSRVTEDIDLRRLARRQPMPVFGALGSVVAIGTVGVLRALRQRQLRRSDGELDALIARLGGRVDKLKGKARGRLRDQLRKEIREVESGPRAKDAAWTAATAALTAGLTLMARRFASRLVGDEELTEEDAT